MPRRYNSWCRKCGAGRDPDEAGPLYDRVWILDITRYSDGSEQAYLECQNCGHRWSADRGYSNYRKAPEFEVKTPGDFASRPYKG